MIYLYSSKGFIKVGEGIFPNSGQFLPLAVSWKADDEEGFYFFFSIGEFFVILFYTLFSYFVFWNKNINIYFYILFRFKVEKKNML